MPQWLNSNKRTALADALVLEDVQPVEQRVFPLDGAECSRGARGAILIPFATGSHRLTTIVGSYGFCDMVSDCFRK